LLLHLLFVHLPLFCPPILKPDFHLQKDKDDDAEMGMNAAKHDDPQGPPGAKGASQSLEEKTEMKSKAEPPLPAWAAALPLPSPISTRDMVLPGHHNTDLPFSEPKGSGQLGFAADGDVAAVVKLLLQLQALVVRVHHPVLVFRPGLAWQREKRGSELRGDGKEG